MYVLHFILHILYRYLFLQRKENQFSLLNLCLSLCVCVSVNLTLYHNNVNALSVCCFYLLKCVSSFYFILLWRTFSTLNVCVVVFFILIKNSLCCFTYTCSINQKKDCCIIFLCNHANKRKIFGHTFSSLDSIN